MNSIMDPTVPFGGTDGGALAPSEPSQKIRLLVEGWRFLAHSYSIINHQQCLELLKRDGVELFHRDSFVFPMLGNAVFDMMGRDAENKIESLPKLPANEKVDAVYRIGYPFDFSGSPFAATLVFATCEDGTIKPDGIMGHTKSAGQFMRPFHQRISENNITLITPSEWSKRGFVRCGVDADRIVVIPHGVDPDVFKPLSAEDRAALRTERKQDGLFVFLNVGAMTGNKNPGGLIRAFLEVAKKHPNARLLLKGIDQMYNSRQWINWELARMSPQERELAKTTIYYFGTALSQVDQAAIYQAVDAYVSPYLFEAFNIPVLEAAACGLPVITTHGGPTDEFTTPEFCLPVKAKLGDHSHDGHLWLNPDHDSLVAQMERVMSDDEWRSNAVIASTKHAHQNYSWSVVVDQLLSVVRSKVSLKGSR